MKREHFVKVVEETLDSLPQEFRSRIRNVAVLVEDMPPNQPSPQPGQQRRLLLGVFHGVPTTKKSTFDLDLFNRQVVGWSLGEDMRCELVIDAFEMAWFRRHPGRKTELIFHSDRGSQYASQPFQELLRGRGIQASMSRKGDCWDNACSETLFGSLKVERLHGLHFETLRQ